jgi:hypothetical protein
MVPPRSSRGWGREGFGAGKRGRGDGSGGVKVMHGGTLAGGEGGSSTNSKEMLKPSL